MRSVWRTWAKTLVGSGLDIVSPQIGAEIDTGAASGNSVRLKKIVLHARLEKARRRGDSAEVQKLLHLFWQGDTSADFYARYTGRFNSWFMGPHQEIIEAMITEVGRRPYRQVIEVGCGDGRVLQHLAARLVDIDRFIGVDINPKIIELNRRVYRGDDRLSFIAGNAADLMDGLVGDGTILMTYGGVMEYFSDTELGMLFTRLAQQSGTMIAAVEPVDPAHDLFNELRSYPFGTENSFSHNHRHLLQTSGYSIVHHSEMDLGGVRWVLVLARHPA